MGVNFIENETQLKLVPTFLSKYLSRSRHGCFLFLLTLGSVAIADVFGIIFVASGCVSSNSVGTLWGGSYSFFLPDCDHRVIFLSPFSLIIVSRVEILFEKCFGTALFLSAAISGSLDFKSKASC